MAFKSIRQDFTAKKAQKPLNLRGKWMRWVARGSIKKGELKIDYELRQTWREKNSQISILHKLAVLATLYWPFSQIEYKKRKVCM